MASHAKHSQPDAPANGAFSITPADSDLNRIIRGFYVGVTGNVQVTTLDEQIVVFVAIPAGQIMPVSCQRVWSTNTTASSIVGLY